MGPPYSAAEMHHHTLATNPLAFVTLAAFWHDLVVAGDQVIIERDASTRRRTGGQSDRGGHASNVHVLPRTHIYVGGVRQRSDSADHEMIERRSHGVRGHLRKLPDGWSRSESAEDTARIWGFVLPAGWTFVHPHTRGGHDHDPQPVVAKARGLQTLALLV